MPIASKAGSLVFIGFMLPEDMCAYFQWGLRWTWPGMGQGILLRAARLPGR